nr:hypothetical protein BOSE7B_90385 [Bosea sp. 7B]
MASRRAKVPLPEAAGPSTAMTSRSACWIGEAEGWVAGTIPIFRQCSNEGRVLKHGARRCEAVLRRASPACAAAKSIFDRDALPD